MQGECNEKEKPQVFHFSLPSRRLSYEKLVQGECNEKEKPQVFHFSLPSRRLSYEKLVQGYEKKRTDLYREFQSLLIACRLDLTGCEIEFTSCRVEITSPELFFSTRRVVKNSSGLFRAASQPSWGGRGGYCISLSWSAALSSYCCCSFTSSFINFCVIFSVPGCP